MARKTVIQIPTPPSLYTKIETYKIKTGSISMADSCRELLEFALLIKEKSEDNDSRTNRELMEEILLLQHCNLQLNKQLYMNTWDENKKFSSVIVDVMKRNVARLNEKAQVAFDAFMNKLDK